MALLTYMLDQSIPCQPSHWTGAPILVSLLTSKDTIKLLMQLVSVSAYNCYPLVEARKSVRQVIIACRKCTMIQWGPHVHGSTWVFILPPPHSEKKKYATLSQESAMPAKAHSHRYKLQPKNRTKTNQKIRKEPLPNLKSCLYRWKLVGLHELRCWIFWRLHMLKPPIKSWKRNWTSETSPLAPFSIATCQVIGLTSSGSFLWKPLVCSFILIHFFECLHRA